MSTSYIKFHEVSFQYESGIESLFDKLSLHIDTGWSGIVGANGSGKTTLLKLASGLLQPIEGHITKPDNVVYCPQRTDHAPENIDAFFSSNTKNSQILKGRLAIKENWIERWSTLSHGERKRVQIGNALWMEPDVLAIDEPTNHVDVQAKALLLNALQSFSGIGLLVSHDRQFLDTLCRQCIFIDPPDVKIRPGGYTKGKEIAGAEQKTIRKQYVVKKQVYKKLKKEAGKRRDLAKQSDKKRSKRGIAKKDHDAKGKLDLVRLTGKDATAGKLLNQLEGRLERSQKELQNITVKKQYSMGIWFPGSQSKRDLLLDLKEGELLLGDQKYLKYPRLFITPEDRIAITGPNGAGKSSLLKKIIPELNVPKQRITYVPQEIDQAQSQQILEQVQALPRDQKGILMTIVSCLGSRPQRLLDSRLPSPGETRKLSLALGMTREPHIIIMDEPTNHMDLPSIECLEQALLECPCCLILISHDNQFLGNLTEKRWDVIAINEKQSNLKIMNAWS